MGYPVLALTYNSNHTGFDVDYQNYLTQYLFQDHKFTHPAPLVPQCLTLQGPADEFLANVIYTFNYSRPPLNPAEAVFRVVGDPFKIRVIKLYRGDNRELALQKFCNELVKSILIPQILPQSTSAIQENHKRPEPDEVKQAEIDAGHAVKKAKIVIEATNAIPEQCGKKKSKLHKAVLKPQK